MPMTDEDRLLEVLDEGACRQLLGTTRTGRLGFTDGALPAILPVSFVLQDGHVVIPARLSSGVVSAVRGAVVAFEVDSYDALSRVGWSVTVVGPARIVRDPAEAAALQVHWASHPPAPDRCYIAVLLGLLKDRRMSECPTGPRSEGQDGAANTPVR